MRKFQENGFMALLFNDFSICTEPKWVGLYMRWCDKTQILKKKIYPSEQTNLNPCQAEKIVMPRPLPIVSQSDYLIQVVNTNSHTKWCTVQIQISWLLQKPTDLDLHCLQRQCISGFSRTRIKPNAFNPWFYTYSFIFFCTGLDQMHLGLNIWWQQLWTLEMKKLCNLCINF